MSDNVIQGPWSPLPPKDEIEDKDNALLVHALALGLSDAVFLGLHQAGFDNLDEMCYTKDLALVFQAIQSAIFQMQGRYHPLQKIADDVFEWTPAGTVEISQKHIED